MIRQTAPSLILLLLLLFPLAAFSQSLSFNVSGPDAGNVYLQKLDVDVKVTGAIASTTWTMTFRNETSRQLEGELNFPLADGITVSRYAIDINGRLREAVPVDKAKGTTVLEAIENRRVDPGLLERVEGNAFRTRIYPLPPNGTRTVVIGYEEHLHSRTRGQLDYALPLSFARAVPKIDIQVTSFAGTAGQTTPGAGFDQQGYAWSAKKSFDNYRSGKPLQFRIPQPETETALMEVSGNHYYTLINTPARSGSRERPLPDELSILWDASLSRLARNAEAELSLLDAYLKKVRNARITLAVFSNNMHSKQAFTLQDGNWSALREAIRRIVYDGGTQLGAPDLANLPGKEILLFSDGLSTYGAGTISKSKVPVFAISSSTHSDFALLRGAAQSSGGALIDLSSRPLGEAITALTRQELQLLGLKADRDIDEVFPDVPVAAAGGVALTAVSYKAKGSVVLQYGYGREVTQEIRVDLDAERQKAPGANLGRMWAGQKIAALDADYERNRAEIEQLGKRFRLVTRNTSLIVLENLSDYFLYAIEPPEELRAAYNLELKTRGTQALDAARNRLGDAEDAFEDLLGWWRKDHWKENLRNNRIHGRLEDQRGRAIAGANVEARINGAPLAHVKTGSDGSYSLNSLRSGTYTIRFQYQGHEQSLTDIVVGNGQTKQANGNLTLADREPLAKQQRSRRPDNSRIVPGSNGIITGNLKDERGNPIVSAYVEATSGGVVMGRETTDFDGNYTIKALNGGRYTLTFKYQGKELSITDVALSKGQTRYVNGTLVTINTAAMSDVVVRTTRRYVAPLIARSEPGGRSTKTAEQIESSPLRNGVGDIASLSTQTYQQRAAGIATGGARTSGTKVIIDGVQQPPGSADFINLAPGSKEEITTFSSGAPASYGYASGGVSKIAGDASASADEITRIPGTISGVRIADYNFDPELLGALRKSKPADQYTKYLELREQSLHIPAFYFQAAAHFLSTGRNELGLRILSNVAELDLENYELFKSLGYKLRELGETEAAAETFRKVEVWRPMDPQSKRDYGLALADQGKYQAALDTLYAALTMQIDPSLESEAGEMDEVLICDINGLIAMHGKGLDLSRIPRSLIQVMPSDLRVVLNWNMKNTDIDLWVFDPADEKCFYGNSRTAAGGRLSADATDGFGPEQFMLRRAMNGKYKIMVDYYAEDQVKISGPTVISAEIYTNWGTPKEKRQMITMQLKPTDKGGVLVGEFIYKTSLASKKGASESL